MIFGNIDELSRLRVKRREKIMKGHFKLAISILSLSICILFSFNVGVYADDDFPPEIWSKEYVIFVDNDYVNFDVEPIVESGRVLVPVRAIAETLKMVATWNAKTQKVTLSDGNKIIELIIGKKEAFVDGKAVVLDVPAKIVNGRTMVPLRFIGESLNKNVYYNGSYSYINELAGKKIIWVCTYDLLNDNDYRWEDLEKHYIDLGERNYQLKGDSLTHRGIKLGDGIEYVKEKYGIPANHYKFDDEREYLLYMSEYIPGSSIAIFLYFNFDNKRLVEAVVFLSR
jgi:hypothetical protein